MRLVVSVRHLSRLTVQPALSLTCLDAVLCDIFHPLQHSMLRLSRLPQLQVQQLSKITWLLPLADLREEQLRSGTLLGGRDIRRLFSFLDLMVDVCAIAKDLLHDDFKGLVQEELPLGMINNRVTQVARAGWFC